MTRQRQQIHTQGIDIERHFACGLGRIGMQMDAALARCHCALRSQVGLLAHWRHIRAWTVRHFRRHADALTQRRMWVNGLAEVDGIGAHLDRQRDLTNHVARMRADHTAAQDLAVAVRLRAVFKQQFGDTFVAAVGGRCRPRWG